MKLRWDLIQSGTDRDNIRIRGNSIYVNDLRKGSVVNRVLVDSAWPMNLNLSLMVVEVRQTAGADLENKAGGCYSCREVHPAQSAGRNY